MSVTSPVTVFTTVTNKGPECGRGCLVSHIVNINITHKRPQQVRTLLVCEHYSAGPASDNDNGQLFLVLLRAPRHRD